MTELHAFRRNPRPSMPPLRLASFPRRPGARPGRGRRLRDRPGRGGDRAGGRRAVAALLAAGSAHPVARPGRRAAGTAIIAAGACASTPPHSRPPSASSAPGSTISTSASARPPRRRPKSDKPPQTTGQTGAQPAPAPAPAVPDPAIAELRRKLEALESRPRPEADTSALKSEIVALRAALQSLDQAVAGQKASVDKAAEAATPASPASRRRSPPRAARR